MTHLGRRDGIPATMELWLGLLALALAERSTVMRK